jgi:hypothetical protein
MAISNGNYAHIHNISYENINVEFQKYTRAPILQENDQMTYPQNVFARMGETIRITNEKYCKTYDSNIADNRDLKPAKSENISYKNINVYADEEMGNIKIKLHSYSGEVLAENIEIENLKVNGKLIKSFDEVDLINENTTNVVYKA